jgi:predicted MFS family arabinose efflux permease
MNEPITRYQKTVVAILAFLQFTIMIDFMIMAPLGAVLLDELHIDTRQFGLVMSAYAVSAGAASFASASFADRFDRKRLLLFFYAGFLVGTALCGFAPDYEFLLGARIVTGIFGGVVSSIVMTIVADLFPLAIRGRVMGTMMTAFGAAQVAGLPAGLALSNWRGWHAPFLVIAGIGAVVGVGIAFALRPVDAHLATPRQQSAIAHMLRIATKPAYLLVFGTTILLSSGFMLMPLLSAFFVHNLGVPFPQLPIVYAITGAATLVVGPLGGKLADTVGKLKCFVAGTLLCSVLYVVLTNLSGPTALWLVVLVNVGLVAANTARMIPAGALSSAVPAPTDRGAFMSINTSLQQATGGVASFVGGAIVVVQGDGTLARFDVLGWVVVATMLAALVPVRLIARRVQAR